MTYHEVRGSLDAWSAAGTPAAVATLIRVRRSAPREPGARFAVSAAGEVAGSISSGCVEGDLQAHLESILEGGSAGILEYGISDELALGVGLSCGGEIEVLAERHDPADPVWEALAHAVDDRIPAVLVSGLDGPARSRRLLIHEAEGADRMRLVAIGTLGTRALDRAAREVAEEALGRHRTEVLALPEGERETSVFVESFAPPPRLLIVGATEIARALCEFAARDGFEVSIVDPRTAFAVSERFPSASRVLGEWPRESMRELGVDRHTRVVVLSHDAKVDGPALAAALEAGCAYVGLLGGRRTQEERRRSLRELGFADEDVERIRGPVGLDIGARSPAQIAVAILAELISEGLAP